MGDAGAIATTLSFTDKRPPLLQRCTSFHVLSMVENRLVYDRGTRFFVIPITCIRSPVPGVVDCRSPLQSTIGTDAAVKGHENDDVTGRRASR